MPEKERWRNEDASRQRTDPQETRKGQGALNPTIDVKTRIVGKAFLIALGHT